MTKPKVKAAHARKPKGPAAKAPAKTGMIRARVDRKLKDDAERIPRNTGLNASEAIRLFYHQIVMYRGLPFEVKIPNEETLQAMRDADAGKVTRYGSVAEMFEKMGIRRGQA